MDGSLDDAIVDRQRRNYNSRDRRGPRYPRDGVRKPPPQSESRNIDRDEWLHDRYEDDLDSRRPARYPREDKYERPNRNADLTSPGSKLRVENFHYDLTEDDLRELFSRVGRVRSCTLLYDRQDRSKGIGFVVYDDEREAIEAIRQFNGANANGQPISITMAPPSQPKAARNPFDYAEKPSRSLFERIEPVEESGNGGIREDPPRRRRGRSASPTGEGVRHSDVSKPPPEHIDRYVPPGRRERRSPLPPRRGGGSRTEGRRPGTKREGSDRRGPARDDDGRTVVQGRPRKTVQELDAEMEDYWGSKGDAGASNEARAEAGPATSKLADDDVDMIE